MSRPEHVVGLPASFASVQELHDILIGILNERLGLVCHQSRPVRLDGGTGDVFVVHAGILGLLRAWLSEDAAGVDLLR